MKKLNNNLSIVLLDDDEASLLHIKQLLASIQFASVIATFNNPVKFVEEFSKLNFDLLILDCEMPGMSGKDIIKKVGAERCIVNTASKHKYEEAIKRHPIDILIKPVNEKALRGALNKAKIIIGDSSAMDDYAMFNTAKKGGKVWLKLSNIVFITTDKDGPRNKLLILKDGTRHILMDYTIDELYQYTPHLIRPNNSTLISPEVIQKNGYNFFELAILNESGQQIMVNISRTFSSEFKNHLHRM